jgi:hypothetical protein
MIDHLVELDTLKKSLKNTHDRLFGNIGLYATLKLCMHREAEIGA